MSIDALRKVLPGCFRFAGVGGVEDRLAGIPFDEGPLIKCRRHGQDLCRPSFAGEAILNYRAAAGAVALLVPQEVGAAAISSVLLGWVLAIAVGCDLADGAADRLGRHLHAYRHARGLELSRAAGGIAKGLKRAPVVFATWRGSGRSRALVLLLLITTLLAVGQYVVIAFAGALLIRLTDATPGKIAAAFALFGVMTLVGNLCASRVVQRWGAFTTSAFFMACVVLGAGLWAFGAGIYPSMAAGAVIWGFGFAAVTAMQQVRLIMTAPSPLIIPRSISVRP